MLAAYRLGLLAVLTILVGHTLAPSAPAADDDTLKKAVTFYASFDEAFKADFGGGDLSPYTGIRPDPGKPKPEPVKGADAKIFTIAKKGIAGGCLEPVDGLPNNGRIFFRAKDNIAYKKGGWGGAISMWINFDPDKMLKTKFCDPVQITHKGANNGAIWFDFNDAKPRDMRHGAFSAVKDGEKMIPEDDPKAPMVRVPKVGFKSGDWHHIVISWKNFDTGKPDAVSQFYVDGKLMGEVKDRIISMDWDIEKVGIFTAINYIGLLDEFAIFNRPLTPDEIDLLRKKPGLLAPLKKVGIGMPSLDDLRVEVRRGENFLKLQQKAHFHPEEIRWFKQNHEDACLALQQIEREGYYGFASDPTARDRIIEGNFRRLDRSIYLLKRGLISREVLHSEIENFLKQDGSEPYAEKSVQLVWQARPESKPPDPPKFPYAAETAKRYQDDYATWASLPVEFTNHLGMTFRLIPPGTFLMGSPDNEPGHNSSEYADGPIHPVTITRSFYLSKHETTVGQFRRFVEAEKYVTDIEKKGGGNAHDEKAVWKHRPGTEWRKPGFAGPFDLKDEHPVVHVSWTDAKNFCAWLNTLPSGSRLTDVNYDLPTEAQWEYSCRAGTATRFWWGADEDTTGKVLNCGDRSLKKIHPDWPRSIMAMDDGHAFLAPVGSYRPNAWGLHDMLGNVWEYCSTHYGPYPKEAVTDPGHIDPKRGYAVRGGGWSNVASDCRCASRNADPPHFGHSNLGFRVALLLPNK